MRILVTGPRGFVGARVMDELGRDAIPAPSLRAVDEESIRRMVDEAQPDLIIHTAAMSDIPTCENDPDGSYYANVKVPVWLARTGIKCVMFSTDQVYSGCAGEGPYAEEETAPSNLYSRHKLEMEQRTLDINPDTVHLRATWMYDMPKYGVPNRGNFLVNMLRQSDIAFSSTQHRAVTYVREVSGWIRQAALLPGGAYNYGSENTLTCFYFQIPNLKRPSLKHRACLPLPAVSSSAFLFRSLEHNQVPYQSFRLSYRYPLCLQTYITLKAKKSEIEC